MKYCLLHEKHKAEVHLKISKLINELNKMHCMFLGILEFLTLYQMNAHLTYRNTSIISVCFILIAMEDNTLYLIMKACVLAETHFRHWA